MSDDAVEMTFEVAVTAGLDAVWDLLTTGEGRAAWFGTDGEIDLVVGGTSWVGWGGRERIDAAVDHVEPMRRLRLVYTHDGEVGGAEEWLLSHADGVTHVRLVQSFPERPDDGWDGWFGDLARGWRLFLASLVHAASTATTPRRVALPAYVPAPAGCQATGAALRRALVPDGPAAGVAVGDEVVLLGTDVAARIAFVEEGALLLTTPRRTLLVDVEGGGDRVVAYVQAATHGPDDEDEQRWREDVVDRLAAVVTAAT